MVVIEVTLEYLAEANLGVPASEEQIEYARQQLLKVLEKVCAKERELQAANERIRTLQTREETMERALKNAIQNLERKLDETNVQIKKMLKALCFSNISIGSMDLRLDYYGTQSQSGVSIGLETIRGTPSTSERLRKIAYDFVTQRRESLDRSLQELEDAKAQRTFLSWARIHRLVRVQLKESPWDQNLLHWEQEETRKEISKMELRQKALKRALHCTIPRFERKLRKTDEKIKQILEFCGTQNGADLADVGSLARLLADL